MFMWIRLTKPGLCVTIAKSGVTSVVRHWNQRNVTLHVTIVLDIDITKTLAVYIFNLVVRFLLRSHKTCPIRHDEMIYSSDITEYAEYSMRKC